MSIQGRKSTPWLEQAEPQNVVLLPPPVTTGVLHTGCGDVIHLGERFY